ncbi:MULTISPECIES: HtaA domain-containing protein [unclassified Leucobacter]|uniref:HtaA domain-containing protein n=1 Tax=unclassified Leucobacter TaxID=2621730 RepID=UPI00165DF47D|nr:HtaA domain-containing protein [Leucobacter sp. CX169]MBC9927572.1 HtaA domain-containing protein [Leucobacter sp. cx-169]
MNVRPLTRKLTAVLGGAFAALGVVAACAMAPAAVATPLVASPAAGPVASEAGVGCTISDASLSWGVIERWRAYITGTIANGDWTLNDGVEYETPAFRWAAGSGALEADGSGTIGFTGGVHFTGHEGLLQLDVANPTLELVSPTEAYLLLDLASTKQTGEPDVSLPQVRAVKLDLTGTIIVNGVTLEIVDAPGRFTAEGASAFGGFYAAGEEVDPLSLTAQAEGCALEADAADKAAEEAPSEVAEPVTGVIEEEQPGVPWLPIGIGAVALLVIAGATFALVRSGRKPAAADAAESTPDEARGEAPTDPNA